MNLKACLAVFLLPMVLTSCYHVVKPDAGFDFQKAPSKAGRFLSVIQQKNNAVSSFKGIGKIRIWDSGASRTTRAAWLGALDGRLRIEFLGLPGQPVAKFIFDGTRYFFVSDMDSQVYSKTSSDPDLEQVTGVAIKAGEVIKYLAGGIPVYVHDAVLLEQSESGNIDVLVLKKNWLGVVEKIFFNGSEIEKVEIYKWGIKTYQVAFKYQNTASQHQGPSYLAVTNGEGQGFSFAVDRQWAGIKVLPSMFEMIPAD